MEFPCKTCDTTYCGNCSALEDYKDWLKEAPAANYKPPRAGEEGVVYCKMFASYIYCERPTCEGCAFSRGGDNVRSDESSDIRISG